MRPRYREADAQGREGKLTPQEASAVTQVDPATLARWADEGKVTAVRSPGGHRLYDEAEIRAIAPPGKSIGTTRASHLLRLSAKTVTRLADEKVLACTRTPGGKRQYLESDVLALAAALAGGAA